MLCKETLLITQKYSRLDGTLCTRKKVFNNYIKTPHYFKKLF